MTKVRQDGLDRYKLAVRTWSDQDANVRETFMKAYQSRLKFIGQFFQRFGFHGKDADIRTEVLLCFMIWELNLHPNDPMRRQLERLRLQHDLLTRI